MVLRILQANATYGKLNQSQLSLHPGLNVICAPNEGGKSTWSRFLLAMFYGLNTRQRGDLADKNRFQPWNGSPMQGKLELAVGSDRRHDSVAVERTGEEVATSTKTELLCRHGYSRLRHRRPSLRRNSAGGASKCLSAVCFHLRRQHGH